MFDGVFEERLEQQGRQQTRFGVFLNLLMNRQARSKAHLLNRHIFLQQVQFLEEAHRGLFTQTQGQSQEVAEQHAHIPRTSRIDAGQSTYGIQAVKQEMRIDLSLRAFSSACRARIFISITRASASREASKERITYC